MARAHRKWVKNDRDSSVRPIMLRQVAIPLEFDDIQAASLGSLADTMERILDDLVPRPITAAPRSVPGTEGSTQS